MLVIVPTLQKKATLKCLDCDFFLENERTMEVYIGKSHSEILESGICEHKADDLEALETHLFTCELFRCNHCKLKMKDLKN